MITIQKYVRAQSLEEAYQLHQSKRNRIVGGMMWMRLGRGSVGTAIDLCDLGLNTIEETHEQFSMGAMVWASRRESPAARALTKSTVWGGAEVPSSSSFRA